AALGWTRAAVAWAASLRARRPPARDLPCIIVIFSRGRALSPFLLKGPRAPVAVTDSRSTRHATFHVLARPTRAERLQRRPVSLCLRGCCRRRRCCCCFCYRNLLTRRTNSRPPW